MTLDLTGVDLLTESVSTHRLLLRPFRVDDAEAVCQACQDEDIQRWVVAVPSPYTLDDARHFVSELAWEERRTGTGLQFAVAERGSGRVAASVGLMRLRASIGAEIGYWVAPWARGHGYAAEATDALAGWAFRHGLHRVVLLIAPENTGSCRTAERAGFRREGRLREAEVARQGERRDFVLYARLATDPGLREPAGRHDDPKTGHQRHARGTETRRK
ncbi:MAG: GNAT family N-acetyltransferase [Geodermatophilaceae bacterium]|nr:GNAT family N-acetyltransferase [Geodermatophilaceae bacterium]